MNSGYDGGAFYLKIKVKITGSAADGSQNAEGIIVVRINQQQNEIVVNQVTANNTGMLSTSSGAAPRCADQIGKATCYVTKNEIIGITIPPNSKSGTAPFTWTINGETIACNSAMSAECANGHTLFFPILGNVGEAVDVVAKGLDKNGEVIEVRRHFVIGTTQLQITSLDPSSFCGTQCLASGSACPKYLGFYKDLGGFQYPDCSAQVWETTEGKTVTLGTTGQTGFNWAIDGQIIPEYKDQNQIQLVINKAAGESYNIGLSSYLSSANVAQFGNLRKALYKNWGISPEETIEENQSANIQLDVVYGQGATNYEQASLGASLITHLPAQAMFVLKISLTSILLLLVTGLLFAFMPGALVKEEELE